MIQFVLAALVFVFAFRIVFTLLALGSPLILAAHAYILAQREVEPPSPDPFIDTDLDVVVVQLGESLDKLRAVVSECYDIGAANGLSRTDKSGGRRFDARKSLGRDLNQTMETAEQTMREQQALLSEAVGRRQANRASYAQLVRRWSRPVASNRAIGIAVIAVVVTFIVSMLFDLNDLVQSVMLFNAFNIKAAIAAPAAIGALAWVVAYRVVLNREVERSPLLHAYDELSVRLADARLENEELLDDDASDQSDRTEAGDETWYDVLNVTADATIEQIKAAYRAAIKQYHPDSVQGRGAKIVALAEHETRRLNDAYGRAQAIRGF